MLLKVKYFIKSLLPPILFNVLQKYRTQKYGWKGDYLTWQQAKNASTGYDTDKIIDAVKNALLKVKKGEAVYERDSVIFDEIQYSWPLLAGLMFVAVKLGEVKVLDFGGSLGSTYYQNKKFLDRIESVSWSIVEQERFVEAGKTEFEDNRLNFFHTVDECVIKNRPNVLLLSSVLQYIEKPYELLDDILKHDFEYILIDRNPFVNLREKITLQVVSPAIYEASYPCHFFNEERFIEYFAKKQYLIVETFISNDGKNNDCIFKGMILEKNHA